MESSKSDQKCSVVLLNLNGKSVSVEGKSEYAEDPAADNWTHGKGKARHCSYCLLSIPEKEVKVCGKCQKRAYCSRDCQTLDWSVNGEGQGHKRWCGVDYGEEDLDWKVAPVAGKGLGVIAKRAFPALTRIMVDQGRPVCNPRARDLAPIDDPVEAKLLRNCLDVYDAGFPMESGPPMKVLCLRMARVNHSCNANASHVNDLTDYKVKILFAKRDIAEGEEICINYTGFTDLRCAKSASYSKRELRKTWEIVCPLDCFCYNAEQRKIVKEIADLETKIEELALAEKLDLALELLEDLLKKFDVAGAACEIKAHFLFFGFQMAIATKETLEQAQKFIGGSLDIYSALLHPKSDIVREYAVYKQDFSKNPHYLMSGRRRHR